MAHSPQPSRPNHRKALIAAVCAGVLVIALGITWALGGLDEEHKSTAKPGEIVDQGRFDVQVSDARSGELPIKAGLGKTEKHRLLAVRMRVVNTSNESAPVDDFFQGVYGTHGAGKSARADRKMSRAYVGTPDSDTAKLPPRLPVTVEAFWPLGKGAEPRAIKLELRGWEFTEHGFIDGSTIWIAPKDGANAGIITLPVRNGAAS